jgi:hypothetical protein
VSDRNAPHQAASQRRERANRVANVGKAARAKLCYRRFFWMAELDAASKRERISQHAPERTGLVYAQNEEK